MRPQKIETSEILNGLFQVFRSKGYEGTSLADMEHYSGLKKASLYHRFPGGKKEIAQAVLSYAKQWTTANIYEILIASDRLPADRLDHALEAIKQLYDYGNKHCILRSFSMETGGDLFSTPIQHAMEQWIDGFTQLGRDFGFTKQQSKEKARKVLVLIQGGLLVAKGLKTIAIFNSILDEIKQLYHHNKNL